MVRNWDEEILFVCYNNINNSLLTIVSVEGMKRIIKTKIKAITTGQNTDQNTKHYKESRCGYFCLNGSIQDQY
jgi:hypothetical protein